MRQHKRMVALTLLLIALTGLLVFAAASPGSDQDPLITLSYIEKRILALQSELNTRFEAIEKQLLNGVSSTGGTQAIYEAYSFPGGTQVLLGKGTEFILRRGSALVIDPSGNALPDLTEGIDLSEGTQVPANHILLSPRDDGRGIIATTAITVMIKGKYQILQPAKE